MLAQQAAVAVDALEGIVGCALLVETEVVLVGLFVLKLLNISPNDDTDIELDEKADDVADDETNLFAPAEHRTASDLLEVLVIALNQGALREHEVEGESSQSERE